MLSQTDRKFLKDARVSISSDLGANVPPSFPRYDDAKHIRYLTLRNGELDGMYQRAHWAAGRSEYYAKQWKALAFAGWVLFVFTALGWISSLGRN